MLTDMPFGPPGYQGSREYGTCDPDIVLPLQTTVLEHLAMADVVLVSSAVVNG